MIRLGIVSDTHGQLRNRVLELLDGVDHILHAGDVGDPDILIALEAVAPVSAVWGNTDGFPIRHRTRETVERSFGGLRIALLHGHTLPSLEPEVLFRTFPDADIVVHGHTHRPRTERVGKRWIVNPGSCGPRRFDRPVSIATARIDDGSFAIELHTLGGTP